MKSNTVNQMEVVDDNFIRKLKGMANTPNESVPVLIKHLNEGVRPGQEAGITCNKFHGGIDKFTEVKYIHNGACGAVHRSEVREDPRGAAAVNN